MAWLKIGLPNDIDILSSSLPNWAWKALAFMKKKGTSLKKKAKKKYRGGWKKSVLHYLITNNAD